MKQAERNNVQLLWVPGHEGIEEHETADHLARRGSVNRFVGTEPAYDTSKGVGKQAIRDGVCRECQECWQLNTG
jgi:ribonuclease HI